MRKKVPPYHHHSFLALLLFFLGGIFIFESVFGVDMGEESSNRISAVGRMDPFIRTFSKIYGSDSQGRVLKRDQEEGIGYGRGKFGIGTTFPEALLHINTRGQGSLHSMEGHVLLEADGSSGKGNYGAGILFSEVGGSHGGKEGASIVVIQTTKDQDTAGLTFNVHGPSNGKDRFEAVRIDHNGRVGIGIPDPAKELDVSGDINVSGNVFSSEPTLDNHLATKAYVDASGGSDVELIKDSCGSRYTGSCTAKAACPEGKTIFKCGKGVCNESSGSDSQNCAENMAAKSFSGFEDVSDQYDKTFACDWDDFGGTEASQHKTYGGCGLTSCGYSGSAVLILCQ